MNARPTVSVKILGRQKAAATILLARAFVAGARGTR
jgi:hypothetical protein